MTAFSSMSDWALVFAASMLIGGDANPEKSLRRKDIYLGGGVFRWSVVGGPGGEEGFSELYNEIGILGMRQEEAMTQVRQCVVAMGSLFVDLSPSDRAERVRPLPAAGSPLNVPSA